MNLVRKWWKAALVAATIVIALQVTVSLLARTRQVHNYLVAHLERAFGRSVEVAHFNIQLLPTLRLDADRITVGEDPAFGNEYFLRADRLSAGLRWTGLLRGHFEFGTLALSRPSLILVRGNEGRWNLERWLPPANTAVSRIYGPTQAPQPANRLRKIDFDDGRINFKIVEDKLSFAFTNVSGSVEQVASGRWQLRLEAQPWRSGVTLQSAGTLVASGDIAGTSARLQPAQIHLHWSDASLADLFRLFRGQDYGVRGAFMLDAIVKSDNGEPSSFQGRQAGDWSFVVRAWGTRIHRWDLTERPDNPAINVNASGLWNVAAGTVRAERLDVEAPHSNLRGNALAFSGANPEFTMRFDSAGIQARDLLAWYRAFTPGVVEHVSVEQFFTGTVALRAWPWKLEQAAFSSRGGVATVPGLLEQVRIGALRGAGDGRKLTVDPVHISLNKEDGAAPVKQRKPNQDVHGAVEAAFLRDFMAHQGSVRFNGSVDQVGSILKVAEAFGRPVNHGWELSGGGSGVLSWSWGDSAVSRVWNGKIEISKGQLQAAGLNQPLQLNAASLEWRDGLRNAQISDAKGFGASWSGNVTESAAVDGVRDAKWKFQLHADHLDAAELDRWAGPRARPNWLQRLLPSLLGGATPSPAASELVRRVNAEGQLIVDEFTLEKLSLSQVHVNAGLHNLHLEITDAQAQWAGGQVHGTISAIFSPQPSYEVTADLDRVNLAQLPSLPHIEERFAGVASGNVHLTTQGVGRDELLQHLAGSGDMRLRNVEFQGWDVSASVADGVPRTGVSKWPTGEGAFIVRDRGIVVAGLRLESNGESTLVKGSVSFGRNADLTLQTVNDARRLAHSNEGERALRISGPLDVPRVSVEKVANRQPAD